MPYAKPFLPVPNQIALLQQRGMVISDITKAESYLGRIGYYRLSGYFYPFRQLTYQQGRPVRADQFGAGTEFGTVVDLYVFDKKLRLLLLDAIERIEIAVRVQIALVLGAKSPLAHRDPQFLHGNFARKLQPNGFSAHHEWLQKTDYAFDRSKEEFVKHFKTKYAGDVPPVWIACEAWDFGALSHLFGGLQKADQAHIAAQFGVPSFDVMESWMRTLNVARNTCAHHSRLWNRPLVIQPRWPTAHQVPALAHLSNNVKAQTRFYAVASLARYLLRSINPTTKWSTRLKALTAQLPAHSAISLSDAGFPANWAVEPLWA